MLDKGQREDWFQSNFIIAFSVASAAAFAAFFPWELSRKDPVVDVSLLFTRQFGTSFIMMMAVGAVLFSTIQLLPQLLQENFRYTAMLSGLALMPGGVAMLIMTPVSGQVSGKVQPKYLIAVVRGCHVGVEQKLSGMRKRIVQRQRAVRMWFRVNVIKEGKIAVSNDEVQLFGMHHVQVRHHTAITARRERQTHRLPRARQCPRRRKSCLHQLLPAPSGLGGRLSGPGWRRLQSASSAGSSSPSGSMPWAGRWAPWSPGWSVPAR